MKLNRLFLTMAAVFSVPVLAGILGTTLMLFAFSLPTQRIHRNVRRSLPILTQETDYFSVTPRVHASRMDNYTEAIYLNQALVGKKDAGLWESALGGFQYRGDESMLPVENLNKTFFSPESVSLQKASYRFFNGYEVVLKPLLLFLDYSSIRQLNLTVGFMLLVLLCFLMLKRGLKAYILPVLISFWFINPVSVFLCLTFVGFYYCMIIPCILMLAANRRLNGLRLVLFFDLIGACAFFFNMNYFQLVTFAFPLAFYFMLNGVPSDVWRMMRITLALFVSWFVGYAGMMLFKWILYATVIDSAIFADMLERVLLRTSCMAFEHSISHTAAVLTNLKVGLKSNDWWIALEASFILCIIAKNMKVRIRPKINLADTMLFLMMLMLAISRFVIFANHVYVHSWVTYRILLVPILFFNILIVRVWQKHECK